MNGNDHTTALSRCPRRRHAVEAVAFDDEIVAFDAATATLHHLNLGAATFWRACDGVHTLEDIARSIAERAAEPVAVVQAQLLELADAMAARNLLVFDEHSGCG